MDPFNKLPTELRVKILISTRCLHTISQLTKASPIMLAQSNMSKGYITKKLLASDFEDGMIQDAMAIVLFPSRSALDFDALARDHCLFWARQQFSNPFCQPLESRNRDLIENISKLHQGLMLFIEDYLTKATAVFPPREYLCIPFRMEHHLKFKGQAVCSRFNAANLTSLERKRLLRAFLRYQLKLMMNSEIRELCEESLYRHSGQKFQRWDLQAILCVNEYLKTLYAAMFAQCSNSWLPDIVQGKGSTSSHSPGLLYPDSLCVDPEAYAYDMGCGSYIASRLAFGGFDLVTILLRSTEAGKPGRDRLKEWFKNLHQIHDSRRESSHYLIGHYRSIGIVSEGSENSPGMYQILHSRIIPNYMTLTTTYLQRAWVFLDDARFYPSSSPDANPHFPTEDEALKERYQTMNKDEDYWDHPWRARAPHRSQKWHNEMSPEKTKLEDDQDSELEKASQISLTCGR